MTTAESAITSLMSCRDFEGFAQRVSQPGGFALRNAARERVFETATGKARFTVHPLPKHDLGPGRLLMMTIRSHDQYNTTVYGLSDRYRGVHGGRRVVFMNAEDVRERGLNAGDIVDLTSHFADGPRTAARFRGGPLPHPSRVLCNVLPGGQRPGPPRPRGTKEQHARLEVGGGDGGACTGCPELNCGVTRANRCTS